MERDSDGKIHVKNTSHETGTGAKIGAVGGALVGLIFPPSLLATAALGAGLGAGTGAVVDRVRKRPPIAECKSVAVRDRGERACRCRWSFLVLVGAGRSIAGSRDRDPTSRAGTSSTDMEG